MTQVGRRAFAAALGGLTSSPTLLAAASREVQDAGLISRQTLAAILELNSQTMNEEQMNRTRQALEMLFRDFDPIRQFEMPPGVEPAACGTRSYRDSTLMKEEAMQDKTRARWRQLVRATGMAVVLCGLLAGDGLTQERGDRLNTLIERAEQGQIIFSGESYRMLPDLEHDLFGLLKCSPA